MSALICGSSAYDTIMVFQDKFKNHILPDKVHMLNVSFYVPDMRREFGGCAGNIAYNLRLLGGKPLPMGTVGSDFSPYADWMDQVGIDRTHVTEADGRYTGTRKPRRQKTGLVSWGRSICNLHFSICSLQFPRRSRGHRHSGGD